MDHPCASISPVLFAAVSGSTNGNNTLVAAAGAGKKIRVLGLVLTAAGTATITLQTGAGGTALSGAMPMVANEQMVWPVSMVGWCETGANALLNMALSAGVAVTGVLVYQVIGGAY